MTDYHVELSIIYVCQTTLILIHRQIPSEQLDEVNKADSSPQLPPQ